MAELTLLVVGRFTGVTDSNGMTQCFLTGSVRTAATSREQIDFVHPFVSVSCDTVTSTWFLAAACADNRTRREKEKNKEEDSERRNDK